MTLAWHGVAFDFDGEAVLEPSDFVVNEQRPAEYVADRVNGIQRSKRVLKDHLY